MLNNIPVLVCIFTMYNWSQHLSIYNEAAVSSEDLSEPNPSHKISQS